MIRDEMKIAGQDTRGQAGVGKRDMDLAEGPGIRFEMQRNDRMARGDYDQLCSTRERERIPGCCMDSSEKVFERVREFGRRLKHGFGQSKSHVEPRLVHLGSDATAGKSLRMRATQGGGVA